MEPGSGEAAGSIRSFFHFSKRAFKKNFSFNLKLKTARGAGCREYIREKEVEAPPLLPVHPTFPLGADSERVLPKGSEWHLERGVCLDELFASLA